MSETKPKTYQELLTENKTLKAQAEQRQQRILALEADKTDLLKNLTQTQKKHQTYLNQTKQQIQKEIILIKEALK